MPFPRRHRDLRMTIDRDKIWTGDLNRRALEPQPHDTVGLYDTTLRDGEQTVGVVLSPKDKLEIARALDEAGVDRIEAGFPRVSEEDAEAIRLIADAGLRAEVWGFSRAVPADVEALVELGVRFAVVESPISDLKLEALGVSRETMLERIAKAVSFATGHGITVAFFGVDSTRADLEFYRQAYSTAVEAGRGRGGRGGHDRRRDARGRGVPRRPDGRMGRRPGALARAQRLRARDRGRRRRRAGRSDLDPGHRERDGRAGRQRQPARGGTRARGALRDPDAARPGEGPRRSPTLVQKRSGYRLEPWKPLTGDNLFTRESGAVASQFHDPPAIEPYSSELVGAERAIVLGKKSGLDSIRLKAEQLGLEVDAERHPELLAEVKRLGTQKRRLVSDDEFRGLVEKGAADVAAP